MTTRPKPSAVVFAKDVAALAGFYSQVAEMKPVHSDNDHVVLETDGFQLVVHGVPPHIARTIHISTPPQLREATPLKLCLPVGSIATARAQAAALGGLIAPPAREWSARGFTACDGHDPEGNVFQVRESAG